MANTVHVPPSERPVPTAVAGNKTANGTNECMLDTCMH